MKGRHEEMKSGSIEIVNKLGLHARAASKLINCARTFASRVEIARPGGKAADAKSIMAVMMLEATAGTTLHLACTGSDENDAFHAVAELVANRFGESE